MNSTVRRRKGGVCCVAVGCSMRLGTNLLSEVRMFRFPKDPERRKKWVYAVNRKDWECNRNSRLCNRHFISGQPCSDPLSPDYVPTIFSHTRTRKTRLNQALKRYERSVKKSKIEVSPKLTSTIPDATSSQFSDWTDIGVILSCQPVPPTVTGKHSVGTMTKLSGEDISNKEYLLIEAQTHVTALTACAKQDTFTGRIMNNVKALNFYTNFPNETFFKALLKLIMTNWVPRTQTSLDCSAQLLLVMMKLRLGLMNEDLGFRFSVRKQSVSCIFREWIQRMAVVLAPFIKKPSLESVRQHIPDCFKDANIQHVTSIIECIEVFLQRPFNFDTRSETSSNNKHHSMKFLISITPSGGIEFLSKLFKEEVPDMEIPKLSGFLDTLNANDVVIADSKFGIRESVSLSAETALLGKKRIYPVRVHIRRCISKVKSFGILKTSWPLVHLSPPDNCIGDNILTVVVALCNFT